MAFLELMKPQKNYINHHQQQASSNLNPSVNPISLIRNAALVACSANICLQQPSRYCSRTQFRPVVTLNFIPRMARGGYDFLAVTTSDTRKTQQFRNMKSYIILSLAQSPKILLVYHTSEDIRQLGSDAVSRQEHKMMIQFLKTRNKVTTQTTHLNYHSFRLQPARRLSKRNTTIMVGSSSTATKRAPSAPSWKYHLKPALDY